MSGSGAADEVVAEVVAETETAAGIEMAAETETAAGAATAAEFETTAGTERMAETEMAAESEAAAEVLPTQPPQPAPDPQQSLMRRRGWFVAGWLVSAVAVGAGAGFGILAATGTSKGSATARGPVAPPTTPASAQPSAASGVRPDGTHYGSVKDFLLPMPAGYVPGPDEGGLGNDSTIPPDQADPTVALLFGTLPASDMSTAQGAIASGEMSDGAVRTYANDSGTLDVALTVLRLNPAQSAESAGQFERVVKQSHAYRTGPGVPGHPEALCVLPVTHVGDPLDSMTCLATVEDTFAIVRAEGAVPLDTNDVTQLFGQQLDRLKGGLGT